MAMQILEGDDAPVYIVGEFNLSLKFMQDQLRARRDAATGEVRQAYDDVCYRMDVLIDVVRANGVVQS